MLLVPRWSGDATSDFYPWLESLVPELRAVSPPGHDAPTLESAAAFMKQLELSGETKTLIGHSVGCQFILRHLCSLPVDAELPERVLLVAPWFSVDAPWPSIEPWCLGIPGLDKLRGRCEFTCLLSDDDPFTADHVETRRLLEDQLGANCFLAYGAKHFNRKQEPLVLHMLRGPPKAVLFEKWHGLGNDFVLVHEHEFAAHFTPEKVIKICQRNTGVGADGVLMLCAEPARYAHLQSDGSSAEMCGNGIRCLARFLGEPETTFATPSGAVHTKLVGETDVEVDMGEARDRKLNMEIQGTKCHFVNTGVPHTIVFTEDLASAPVTTLGPLLEHDSAFPNKTNVCFVHVESPTSLSVRFWERGAGATRACGTGACASAVIASALGLVDSGQPVSVTCPGGVMSIRLGSSVLMRGPATKVFSGVMEM